MIFTSRKKKDFINPSIKREKWNNFYQIFYVSFNIYAFSRVFGKLKTLFTLSYYIFKDC